MTRKGIHRLRSHPVETDGKLKYIVVVLGPGIDNRDTFDDLAKGDSPAVVPYLYQVVLDVDDDTRAEPHDVLVDAVIYNLFEEDVDAVVQIASVAKATDVHTGPEAYVLEGAQGFDFAFVVNCRCFRHGPSHSIHPAQ